MSRELPPPTTPWLDGSVVIGESVIGGRGLFASEPLAAGCVVMRLGGRLVSSQELEELLRTSDAYVDTVALFADTHLVLPAGTSVHYGNHSCDPNLWHVGPYDIAARRPIAAGEELTIDYGTQSAGSGFSMVCSCGSSCCRGLVTGEDWRRPDLQLTYAGHWPPVFEERVRHP